MHAADNISHHCSVALLLCFNGQWLCILILRSLKSSGQAVMLIGKVFFSKLKTADIISDNLFCQCLFCSVALLLLYYV